MKVKQTIYLLFSLVTFTSCQSTEQNILDNLAKTSNPKLSPVFSNPNKYKLQIRYTQIDRQENGVPIFTQYNFMLDTTQYFYPASTVKMPVAFLALQRINELNDSLDIEIKDDCIMQHSKIKQINKNQTARIPKISYYSQNGFLKNYINQLFVVSDNDAYNRLYDFLGQDYINQNLRSKNIFSNSRIVHRVGVTGYTQEDHKVTSPVSFLCGQETVYAQDSIYVQRDYFIPLNNSIKGKGYYNDDTKSTVMEPFDMSMKNFINLVDLEESLKRIIFPESYKKEEQYNLTSDDMSFIYHSMSKYPQHYNKYAQDSIMNYDGYVKFFMYGDTKEEIPNHIHIFNKVGFAYGTLTDCAYIFDTKNNVEFFLTATLLVNDNRIFNDGKYEYDEVGIPFLAELGRQIYDYELKRKKEHTPDFSKFIKAIN